MTKEKEHLCEVFVASGYPKETTRKALNKWKSKTTSEKTEEKHDTLCLPYIRGLSESVERAVRDLKVRTVFKTTLTLRRCLTKVKTPTDPINAKGVVYIPCDCGLSLIHI